MLIPLGPSLLAVSVLSALSGGASSLRTEYTLKQGNLFDVAVGSTGTAPDDANMVKVNYVLSNPTKDNLCMDFGGLFADYFQFDTNGYVTPTMFIYDKLSGERVQYLGSVSDVDANSPYYRVLSKGGQIAGTIAVPMELYALQREHEYILEYYEFVYVCEAIQDGQYKVDPGDLGFMAHTGNIILDDRYNGYVFRLKYNFEF